MVICVSLRQKYNLSLEKSIRNGEMMISALLFNDL